MVKAFVFFGAVAIAVPSVAVAHGSVDLDTVKAAASAAFDKLDVNHDGVLDAKELGSRIPRKEWRAAAPNNHKAITKDEYLSYVEPLFKQADRRGEGKLEGAELNSPAARKLERLLK